MLNPMWAMVLCVTLALVHCGSDDGASAAQCQEWSNQASIERRAAQDDADRACSADTDCELFYYGVRCFEDCGYSSAVASSATPALEAAIHEIDESICGRFEDAACTGPIPPPCVGPTGAPSAVCRSGQCTVEITPYM
jgi:hypothetical protein